MIPQGGKVAGNTNIAKCCNPGTSGRLCERLLAGRDPLQGRIFTKSN